MISLVSYNTQQQKHRSRPNVCNCGWWLDIRSNHPYCSHLFKGL